MRKFCIWRIVVYYGRDVFVATVVFFFLYFFFVVAVVVIVGAHTISPFLASAAFPVAIFSSCTFAALFLLLSYILCFHFAVAFHLCRHFSFVCFAFCALFLLSDTRETRERYFQANNIQCDSNRNIRTHKQFFFVSASNVPLFGNRESSAAMAVVWWSKIICFWQFRELKRRKRARAKAHKYTSIASEYILLMMLRWARSVGRHSNDGAAHTIAQKNKYSRKIEGEDADEKKTVRLTRVYVTHVGIADTLKPRAQLCMEPKRRKKRRRRRTYKQTRTKSGNNNNNERFNGKYFSPSTHKLNSVFTRYTHFFLSLPSLCEWFYRSLHKVGCGCVCFLIFVRISLAASSTTLNVRSIIFCISPPIFGVRSRFSFNGIPSA